MLKSSRLSKLVKIELLLEEQEDLAYEEAEEKYESEKKNEVEERLHLLAVLVKVLHTGGHGGLLCLVLTYTKSNVS